MVSSILQGRWLRHPLHPILIHFPIALLVLSLVFDLLSLVLDGAGIYLRSSLYAMSLGVGTAVLAGVVGFADLLDIRRGSRSRRVALLHLLLNDVAIVVFAVNLWLRWGVWHLQEAVASDRVPSLGLLLSLVGMGLITLSAYLGGRLVYADGIAVGRHRRTTATPRVTLTVSAKASSDGYAPVAKAGSLGEGETLRVSVDGVVVVVARVGGEVYALQEFCTHRYGPLSEGTLRDQHIECPWHRSEFDLRTGEVTAGPAKVPLLAHEVRVEGEELQVRVRGLPDSSAGSD